MSSVVDVVVFPGRKNTVLMPMVEAGLGKSDSNVRYGNGVFLAPCFGLHIRILKQAFRGLRIVHLVLKQTPDSIQNNV
jgi:hypothetical protein